SAAPPAAGGDASAGGAKDILGEWEVTAVDPAPEELAALAMAAIKEKMGDDETELDGTPVDGLIGQKWSISEIEITMDGNAMPYRAEGNKLNMPKPDAAKMDEANPMRALMEMMAMFMPDHFNYTVDGDELKLVSNEIAGYGNKAVTFTLTRAAE
ncbi:MAG: hypothetical protein ACI8W8_004406, partial [Rhodothermales bacterium]